MSFFIPFLVLLTACFSRSAIMTRSSYEEISIGTPISNLKAKVGEPYSIQEQPNGTEEYEYIERIPLGSEVIEENRYYLVVKNGQVVSKRMNQKSPPAYDLIYDDDPNDVEQQ